MPDVPSDSLRNNAPSAFPVLPEDADRLPSIPGGWSLQVIEVADRKIQLYRPDNPDLFLDDAQVHRANEQNDYIPYWAFLWPSALEMAAAMLRADWLAGEEVLELGAGIGLVGLAAMMRGGQVTFSDYDETALHLCRLNARLNQLDDPELLKLDWREIPSRKFRTIIGCEVTYDAALHEPLLKLVQEMLLPGGSCWLGDPGRYQGQFFYEAAQRQGFEVRIVDGRGNESPRPLSNQFQMFQLARA